MRRLLVIPLVAVALAGCGEEDEGGPLSGERYAAIERIYETQLPADDADTADELERVSKDVLAECERADASDPLIAAMVDGCELGLDAALAMGGLERAASDDDAAASTREIAETMGEVARKLASLRAVVMREVADRDCQDALMPERAATVIRRLQAAFAELADALDDGTPGRLEAAIARLDEAAKESEQLGSARDYVDRFRAAC